MELLFDLLGSGYHQGVQLVGGLGAGFDRRTTNHPQRSYRFDRTVPAFGSGGGLPVESSPGGVLSVHGVGFAPEAAQLPVGTVHFHHLDTGSGQMAGQAGAVAAGALHPDPDHAAVGL